MYETAVNIITAVSFLFQAYCLHRFWGSFLEPRIQKKHWHILGLIAAYGLMSFGINLLIPSADADVLTFGKLALSLAAQFILSFTFYKPLPMMQVFLTVSYLAVNQICFFIAHVAMQLGSRLFDLWTWLFERGDIQSAAAFELLIQGTAIFLFILLDALFIALLYFSLRRLAGNFREKDYIIHRTELLFILTPGMVGLLICVLLRSIMITVEDGIPKTLYDKHPILILLVPAIMVLCLLSIQYGVKLFQDMIDRNRQRSSNIILEKQIGGMQEHIAEIERVHAGVQGVKHDMRNTLSVISQLAAQEGNAENPELEAYLTELNSTLDDLDYRFKTGNTVVDALINMKYHEIIRIIPDLALNADGLLFPRDLDIQSYDIGIIMGNALDNALEACRKLKAAGPDEKAFIRVSSFVRGKMLFIEVANSFDGRLNRGKGAEFPITDKADRQAHGLGFLNMKNAAAKYHGAVDWMANNRVFTLTVMLKNERRDDDEH